MHESCLELSKGRKPYNAKDVVPFCKFLRFFKEIWVFVVPFALVHDFWGRQSKGHNMHESCGTF